MWCSWCKLIKITNRARFTVVGTLFDNGNDVITCSKLKVEQRAMHFATAVEHDYLLNRRLVTLWCLKPKGKIIPWWAHESRWDWRLIGTWQQSHDSTSFERDWETDGWLHLWAPTWPCKTLYTLRLQRWSCFGLTCRELNRANRYWNTTVSLLKVRIPNTQAMPSNGSNTTADLKTSLLWKKPLLTKLSFIEHFHCSTVLFTKCFSPVECS